MNWRRVLTVVSGLCLVLAGGWYAYRATAGDPVTGSRPLFRVVVGLLALAGLVWALWQVRAGGPGESDEVAESATPIRTPAPERTPAETALSGRDLAERLDAAGSVAHEEGSVEAGLETLRPSLRDTLVTVLVTSGTDREAAVDAVDAGTWTENETAAAVLSASVTPPNRSFRERVRAWLRPERVLRERVRQAVAELDATAGEQLPTIAGHRAPKRVRVVQPRLETLRRDVDGSLQPAGTPVGTGPGTTAAGGAVTGTDDPETDVTEPADDQTEGS